MVGGIFVLIAVYLMILIPIYNLINYKANFQVFLK